jgi:hypothetical protein
MTQSLCYEHMRMIQLKTRVCRHHGGLKEGGCKLTRDLISIPGCRLRPL